jgi:hypothetical protein
VNIGTDLRQVVVADTTIFTQIVPGAVFNVVPSDLERKKPITFPSLANPSSSVFYGLVYFEDRYFFSMDKWIFATDKVVTD